MSPALPSDAVRRLILAGESLGDAVRQSIREAAPQLLKTDLPGATAALTNASAYVAAVVIICRSPGEAERVAKIAHDAIGDELTILPSAPFVLGRYGQQPEGRN